MIGSITRLFGRQTTPSATRPASGWRTRLRLESLEERWVPSHALDGVGELTLDGTSTVSALTTDLTIDPSTFQQLELTTIAQQFPPHSGPTTLYLNFDGASDVAAFVSTTGNRDADIQEILFRTSEMFAPFNVQVRRIFGSGNYSTTNGNSTVFIGDTPSHVTYYGGSTPWNHTDAPIRARDTDHQPNSDPWDYAYVDPIYTTNPLASINNQRIALVIGHEAGHTFGLLHTRTMGADPDLLYSTATNPPEVMAYDSASEYEYFMNRTFRLTTYNQGSDGSNYLEPNLEAEWHGDTIWRQNSYTYLKAVLGVRLADDVANVAHRDYANNQAAVDASYIDSPSVSVGPGSTVFGQIGQGDYDVYQLGTPAAINYAVSIVVNPTYGSNLDTSLLIFDNVTGNRVAYGSNPGSDLSGLASRITFQREAGHTYSVVVGAFNGANGGNYQLSITNIVPTPIFSGSPSTTKTTTTTTTTTSTTTTLPSSSLPGLGSANDDAISSAQPTGETTILPTQDLPFTSTVGTLAAVPAVQRRLSVDAPLANEAVVVGTHPDRSSGVALARLTASDHADNLPAGLDVGDLDALDLIQVPGRLFHPGR